MNEITNSKWTTKTLADGSLSITGYNGIDTAITIPADIGGKAVSEIDNEAFWGNEVLTELIISEGVRRVGCAAFCLCRSLRTLCLPTSLEYIQDEAFAMCNSLGKVFIPEKVMYIGNNTFAMCERLVDIDVSSSNNVFIVQDGMLFNKKTKTIIVCSKAASGQLRLPDDIIEISSYAFSHCNQVNEFVLPTGLAHIGENAFAWCENIQRMFIPDTVEYIEALAFDSCSNLQKVSVYEKCKYGKDSFSPFGSCVEIMVRHRLDEHEYRLK